MKKIIIILFCILLLMIACKPVVKEEQKTEVKEQIKTEVVKEPVEEKKTQVQVIKEDVEVEETETKEENPIKSFLEDAPKTYWFWDDYEKLGAIVDENKRRELVPYEDEYGHITGWGPGLAYWNEQTGDVLVYDGEVMGWALNELRGTNRPEDKIYNYYIKTRLKHDEFPRGPFDWIGEYKDEKPIMVETSPKTIKTPLGGKKLSSKLSLHFKNKKQEGTVIFRFGEYKDILLQIEEHTPAKKIIRNFEFGTESHNAFNQVDLKQLVEPEKDYVTFTIEEYEKLLALE